jgi:hypothetical protein
MKAKIIAIAGVAGLGVLAQANADEIQFVTLPEVVRTSVVRETNIPDYSPTSMEWAPMKSPARLILSRSKMEKCPPLYLAERDPVRPETMGVGEQWSREVA